MPKAGTWRWYFLVNNVKQEGRCCNFFEKNPVWQFEAGCIYDDQLESGTCLRKNLKWCLIPFQNSPLTWTTLTVITSPSWKKNQPKSSVLDPHQQAKPLSFMCTDISLPLGTSQTRRAETSFMKCRRDWKKKRMNLNATLNIRWRQQLLKPMWILYLRGTDEVFCPDFIM